MSEFYSPLLPPTFRSEIGLSGQAGGHTCALPGPSGGLPATNPYLPQEPPYPSPLGQLALDIPVLLGSTTLGWGEMDSLSP